MNTVDERPTAKYSSSCTSAAMPSKPPLPITACGRFGCQAAMTSSNAAAAAPDQA